MADGDGRSFWRAALWLAFLAPFFFGSYGFATWVTSRREHVGSVVFDWERSIPFVPWTIVPYWSLDLLYGASLFLCANRRELSLHARRLIGLQLVAITCFLLFPLKFTFVRPEVGGISGRLFAVLNGFDKPFNQAPSLHIALVVVVGSIYARNLRPRLLRGAAHVWFFLIGLSVLTTWQHHFIDVPTGALLGFVFLWLIPTHGPSPLSNSRLSANRQNLQLAVVYGLGAAAAAALAIVVGGTGLWLLWVTVALTLIALAYVGFGVAPFQKQSGRLSVASTVMLAPYLAAAWLNSRLWTFKNPTARHIADGVWMGRVPSKRDLKVGEFAGVVDLSAELPIRFGTCAYENIAVLDLTVPHPRALSLAANAIERMRGRGKVLVCCALGYSRSASAVAAWLVATGRACDADAAISAIRAIQDRVVFSQAHRDAIALVEAA